MFRRLLFVATVATLVLAACSAAAPAAPALTDPKEILTKSVLTLKDVKSFHFHADVAGQVNFDLMNTGKPSVIDLKDTTADGDLDIANKKTHIAFSAPAILGVTGDVIVIDKTTYTKVSLLGPKYTRTESTAPSDPAAAAGDPTKVIEQINTFLNTPGVAPTKLADEKCGDKDCYHVQLNLTSQQLSGIPGAVPSGASAPTGAGTVDVWVQKTDLRPAKVAVAATMGSQGNVTLTLVISGYDAAVTVNPPADADIEPAAS